MTGLPDVKLTPYIGAVVLNVDLQSLAGVDSVVSHFADWPPAATPSFNLLSFIFVLFLFSVLIAEANLSALVDELVAGNDALVALTEAAQNEKNTK